MYLGLRRRSLIFILFLFMLQITAAKGKDLRDTSINGPCSMAFDSHGNLFVSEDYGNRILRLDLKRNEVAFVAGNGEECCFRDNAPARESSIHHVYSIALDFADNLYIGGHNKDDGAFVRAVDMKTQRIRIVARGHIPVTALGVPLLQANISNPKGIATITIGTLFVSADETNEIVEIGNSAITFAGNPGRKGFLGDGGPALDATFNLPGALALDAQGNLFVTDYFNHRIRRIDGQTHYVNTVAGDGSPTSSGDGGPATTAGIKYPFDVAVDSEANLFVIENGAGTIRRIDSKTGVITRIAGTGRAGFSGDGGLAARADVDPCGIALDQEGNIYLSDISNNRIRRIDRQTGVITTVAGNGLPHRPIIIE